MPHAQQQDSHPAPPDSKESACPPVVRICYWRAAAALYADSGKGVSGLAYATEGSVGLDLRACFAPGTVLNAENALDIPAGERRAIPVGVSVAPTTPGLAGFVYSRSGLGAVHGLTVAQGVGVIDPDFRGEITVYLLNTTTETRSVKQGERIAQLVFQPAVRVLLEEAPALDATTRGTGGFGHTGTH